MNRTEFIRFLLTGGFSAAVNLLSRYLLSFVMPFGYAVVVAYLVGMITAYLLGREFVFEPSGRTVPDEFWRFTLVNVVAVVQVWLVSVGLGVYVFPSVHLSWHRLEFAHFVGVSVPIFTSYVMHRKFSFARAELRR